MIAAAITVTSYLIYGSAPQQSNNLGGSNGRVSRDPCGGATCVPVSPLPRFFSNHNISHHFTVHTSCVSTPKNGKMAPTARIPLFDCLFWAVWHLSVIIIRTLKLASIARSTVGHADPWGLRAWEMLRLQHAFAGPFHYQRESI